MPFELPALPWARDALDPHISPETIDYHYGKHHAGYVKKLNAGVEGTEWAGKALEDIIRGASGGLYNNAAQTWNHTFYWNSLSPNGGGEPQGELRAAIERAFGSVAEFREQFSRIATGHFGSGWAWLVADGDTLKVIDTHDAGNPLTAGYKPLLTCDVWEHAYYIDYRNDRGAYVQAYWNLVNWDFAARNLR